MNNYRVSSISQPQTREVSIDEEFSPRPRPPLHILLLGVTTQGITGADRDWITLANAIGAEEVRFSWAGIEGCEQLRPHLDKHVVTRFIDLHFTPFNYLLWDNAYKQRSSWLWTKILVDYAFRLIPPLRKLHRELKDDPVDIVVTNTSQVLLGAAYAKLIRRPHIWCIKECFDPDVSACRRFTSWIDRMSTAVIVPSQAVAKPFPSTVNIFYEGNDVERIRNGKEGYSRDEVLKKLGLPPERAVVAQVGGIFWLKGQHVTAEALVKLANAIQKPLFSLLFLGSANPDYKEKVKRILANAPQEWRDAVRFHAFDPDDYSYIAAADILVHPSVFSDSFPHAVREAMILGKPVIASRSGGIPEMITDDETGVLVEPENASELAAALDRLISSPQERERLGNAAERFAASYFDIHVRKQNFINLFNNLVAGK